MLYMYIYIYFVNFSCMVFWAQDILIPQEAKFANNLFCYYANS